MVKKILFPTDGSERSGEAARYAISLAKQTGASIIVLNVVDEVVRSMMSVEDIESFMNAANSYLSKVEKEIKEQGVPVSKSVKLGKTADEIIKEAEESGADLIIMASHGRTSLQSAVMGSVTSSVVHKEQNIPVLIIREGVKIKS